MKYEIMLILDPQKTDREIEKLTEEIKSLFNDHDLAFIEEDVWGVRELAHKMKGNKKGYYIVMNFEGEPAGLPLIHKELKLILGIIRYMLVKMPEDYSLMRYDKPVAKKAAAKLSAHAEELQKKVTKSVAKAERTDKKVEKVEAPVEEAPVKEEPTPVEEPAEKVEAEKVEAPAEKAETPVAEEPAEKVEAPAEEAPAEKVEEEKADSKLDEKLQAIIDDADIDL